MEPAIDDWKTFFESWQSLIYANPRDLTLSEKIRLLKMLRKAISHLTVLGRQLLEGSDNERFYDYHVASLISCKDFGFIGKSSLDYLDEIVDDMENELKSSRDLL